MTFQNEFFSQLGLATSGYIAAAMAIGLMQYLVLMRLRSKGGARLGRWASYRSAPNGESFSDRGIGILDLLAPLGISVVLLGGKAIVPLGGSDYRWEFFVLSLSAMVVSIAIYGGVIWPRYDSRIVRYWVGTGISLLAVGLGTAVLYRWAPYHY